MQKVQKNRALSILIIFILVVLTACGGDGDACIDEPTLDTDLKTSDVVIAEQSVEQEDEQPDEQEEGEQPVDQEERRQSEEQEADQEESAVEKLEEGNSSPPPVSTPMPSPTPIPEPTPEEVPTPTEYQRALLSQSCWIRIHGAKAKKHEHCNKYLHCQLMVITARIP